MSGFMNPRQRASARISLHAAQSGKCCYCGCVLVMPENGKHKRAIVKDQHPRMATIEHLQRRADGGSSRLDNLALACRTCNAARGPESWVEYKTLVQAGAA